MLVTIFPEKNCCQKYWGRVFGKMHFFKNNDTTINPRGSFSAKIGSKTGDSLKCYIKNLGGCKKAFSGKI
jgi:hypothetical protein